MADLMMRLQAALGPAYRVERELGGGGMSRVYAAEEVALGRRVVVKVLPPEMGAGVNAERFRREIRLAASLQHPHIVPLLNAGQTDDLVWYTMPLIEGLSLREKLTREGELPVGDAVRILRDVADALAFAHERGVVHRDIKPDNVLISGRHAVVTDFGVAKAINAAADAAALTSKGVALGTPAYMAPEQATAAPLVDHRADLYALGAMAYEMLTGAPPFAGDAQSVLTAHVVEPPTDVSVRRPALPPSLGALVMRCLEKKAADRWQSAAELHAMLERMATPSGGTAPTGAVAPARRRLLAGLGMGVAAIAIVLLARQVSRPGVTPLTVSGIRPVTSEPGVEFQPAISPDGKEVAFVAGPIGSQRLAIRSAVTTSGGGEFLLTDSSLGIVWLPRWSPDGEFVRFLVCPGGDRPSSDACVWKEAGRRGGSVRSVAVPRNAWTASWSPDGARIAFGVDDSLFSASVADPRAVLLAVQPDHPVGGVHSLAWSPDGRRLAYVGGNSEWLWSGNILGSSIWIVDAAGGEPVQITRDLFLNVSPVWLDDRHLLFVSNRDGPRGIYLVEVGRRGARSEPVSVAGASDVHSIAYSTVSRRLAYARFSLRQNIRSFPIAAAGPIPIRDGRRVTDGNQVIEEHDVSPDGRWIVYDNNLGGDADIYKVLLAGGDPVQLTSMPGDEMGPRWSPGGTEIAFYGGPGEIFVVPAEGGTPSRITAGRGSGVTPRWSPSGSQIAYLPGGTGPRALRLVSRERVGGPWREPVELRSDGCQVAAWLPNGSGILCGGDESTITAVSPTGQILWQRDLQALYLLRGVSYPGVFSRDGATLYLLATQDDGRRGLWGIPLAGGTPRLIVSGDDPALSLFGALSVGPDRLYATVSEYESDVWVMTLGR